jgi:hypothetical protein
VTRLAALALLLAGCDPALPPCPGTPQGTFLFELVPTQAVGAACAFARPESPDPFLGVVSWLPGDGAAFCLPRPLAAPKVGTHSGDAVSFSTEEAALQVSGCSCQLALLEAIAGRVLRDGAGDAVEFEGEVVYTLRLSSDPSCDPAAQVCPPPAGESSCCPLVGAGAVPSCEIRYTLKGK